MRSGAYSVMDHLADRIAGTLVRPGADGYDAAMAGTVPIAGTAPTAADS